ncbi:MAG: hypothetical protein AAB692_02270 [Patescibacteria group bacterium]
MNRAGNAYAEIPCPECDSSRKSRGGHCIRCLGTGTVLIRCARCECQALIGYLRFADGDDLVFRTHPLDHEMSRRCRCSRLPFIASKTSGAFIDRPAIRTVRAFMIH